jgi:hypothetical protein
LDMNNVFSVFEDLNWSLDEVTAVKKTDQRVIELEHDVLSYIVAMQELGMTGHQCVAVIKNEFGNSVDTVITDEHKQQAQLIKSHFKNSIMLRRLTGKIVSRWMERVAEIVDNSKTIIGDDVRIAVTLPRFYNEYKQTEAIFKGKVPVEENIFKQDSINENFQFVGSVDRISTKEKQRRYYFANSQNKLLAVFVDLHTGAHNVWDYVTKHTPNIRIQSDCVRIAKQSGQDLQMYMLGADYMLIPID